MILYPMVVLLKTHSTNAKYAFDRALCIIARRTNQQLHIKVLHWRMISKIVMEKHEMPHCTVTALPI